MGKTFVGFGFGPIQSGLFVQEAALSGNFTRYVIAEVSPEIVEAIRGNGGVCSINVAHEDRIEQVNLPRIDIYNPSAAEDREALMQAISQADEMATALPSVRFYDSEDPGSVAKLLAEGIARRSQPMPTLLYAAENNNEAANILREKVSQYLEPRKLTSFHPVDTVIGKMCGVIGDEETIARKRLQTMTPGLRRAVLVEKFNRILVGRAPRGFQRGIGVYIEKEKLEPFEEAKLYGHNAIHALIAYLAALEGLESVADARHSTRIMDVARHAFLEESGSALVKKHAGMSDPLFTPEGYRSYAEDLLVRMTNPNLNDLIARVARDPERKLAWDDRLYGTIRLAMKEGVGTPNLLLGAAAAIHYLARNPGEQRLTASVALPSNPALLTREQVVRVLNDLWKGVKDSSKAELCERTWRAHEALLREGWGARLAPG